MTEWSTIGLTFILVVITAYYAWQNKRMVDEMRRQRAAAIREGHYERRAAILRGILRSIGLVLRDGRVGSEVIPCFLEATSEAHFLLDADTCNYLGEIYATYLKASANRAQWDDLPIGPERKRLIQEHADLITWLAKQPIQLNERFAPHLKIES